jgi:hypothetical protein
LVYANLVGIDCPKDHQSDQRMDEMGKVILQTCDPQLSADFRHILKDTDPSECGARTFEKFIDAASTYFNNPEAA